MELLKSQMMVRTDQLKREIYHNRKFTITENKICDYGSCQHGDTKTANESIISQIDMTTVIIAICDFFQIPSCQHNYIVELYSISHIFHKFE